MAEPVEQLVEKAVAYLPMSVEGIADATLFGPWFKAWMEYERLPARPLTLRERVTGRRHFTSREGTTVTFLVGWRSWLHELRQPPFADDEDDD